MSFQQHRTAVSPVSESILQENTVLRNTYMLLGLTLLFSAFTAGVAMVTNAAPVSPIFTLVGYFGLLFLCNATRNSPMGLLSVFALTGFMGYTIGPILNFYINTLSNGSELVMTSLGATGLIFFALSAYVLTTKKNFSYIGGFLMVGILTAFLMSLAAMIFHLAFLSVIVSGAFVLLSSGMILLQTSEIIHGGERNYIMATITLYVSLYNIFLSLLHLLSSFHRD